MCVAHSPELVLTNTKVIFYFLLFIITFCCAKQRLVFHFIFVIRFTIYMLIHCILLFDSGNNLSVSHVYHSIFLLYSETVYFNNISYFVQAFIKPVIQLNDWTFFKTKYNIITQKKYSWTVYIYSILICIQVISRQIGSVDSLFLLSG